MAVVFNNWKEICLLSKLWPSSVSHRRPVEAEERDFLVEMKVVNETQADLGLTALSSAQVLDIMSADFYEKYDEYMTVVSERKDRTMRTTSYSIVNNTDEPDFFQKSAR